MAYTYAGRYSEVFIDRFGNALASMPVTVYLPDGVTLAPLYVNRTKTPSANPIATDTQGNLTFFAEPGAYIVIATYNGVVQPAVEVSVPIDPVDGAADATNARTVLNGLGAPAASLGLDGDFYIDTDADAIYGPKTAGAWGTGTSLIGPQGPPGSSTSGLHADLTDLTTSGHPASIIANTPAGNIAATNVQAAINELDAEKSGTTHTHAAPDVYFRHLMLMGA